MSPDKPPSEGKPDRAVLSAALAQHSAEIARLRGPDATLPAELVAARDRLRAWQAARLAASFADLADEPRHAAAVRFFLDDLYGAHNLAQRDAEFARVMSKLAALLPAGALEAVTLAFRLDALTESLDLDVARALLKAKADDPVTPAGYAAAYRAAGRPADRAEQIALIGEIGRRLETLAGSATISTTIRLTAGPARALGVRTLHGFVARGLAAFRKIGDAAAFLARVERQETALMRHLFAGGSTADVAPG